MPLSLAYSIIVLTVMGNTLTTPVLGDYAPIPAVCPTQSLLRPASGLSSDESAFRSARKVIADEALVSWLGKTDSGFGTSGITLPTIGLTTSGGGYRSLLLGAGVIQGLDERDSTGTTSGLFQALTYQAGLSGGSWLLSSFAGNNYPTITYLKENLWTQAFEDSLLLPGNLLVFESYAKIVSDLIEKQDAGFDPTLTDPWGRLLSYQLLEGDDGGVGITLSSVASLSNFTSHKVPLPIITSLGVKTFDGECLPGPNATTYEFTPFEFGSWDSDVSAFTPTKYLGTSLNNGVVTGTTCIENYDNLGYVLGTSSSLFNNFCLSVPEPINSTNSIYNDLAALLDIVHDLTTRDLYAVYPNPFFNYTSSTSIPNSHNLISAQKELDLVDGGEALQNNPIFPMLQPARGVDVLLVNDNSADSSTNYPNGTEILTTYVQSFNHNLTRMPYIPSVETFISEGLDQRATFFGCNDTSKITIVYLPNYNFTIADSGVSTAQLAYPESETDAMIANGVAIMEQGGESGWATCLGCAIMEKAGGSLPSACTACFTKYCYYE